MDKSISIDRIAYILTRSHVALVFQPKLLAILLKDVSDRCFVRHQVTPMPARLTRRLRLSFSLHNVNQQRELSSPTETPEHTKPRIPLSGHPDVHAQPVGFRQKGPPRSRAASLSGGAYMALHRKLSTAENTKMSEN